MQLVQSTFVGFALAGRTGPVHQRSSAAKGRPPRWVRGQLFVGTSFRIYVGIYVFARRVSSALSKLRAITCSARQLANPSIARGCRKAEVDEMQFGGKRVVAVVEAAIARGFAMSPFDGLSSCVIDWR